MGLFLFAKNFIAGLICLSHCHLRDQEGELKADRFVIDTYAFARDLTPVH
jgi:hypothetical protein